MAVQSSRSAPLAGRSTGQPRPRYAGRVLRWVATAATAAVVAGSAAACGSSSDSSSSSASEATANVAAAKAALASYTGHPSAFPVDTPLSKALPAGTKFVYLQCGAQACAVAGKLLAAAVQAIKGDLTVLNAGTSASTAQAAASSALAMKPQVVFTTGIEPSLYGDGLKKLSAAGTKVISISVATDTAPYGIDVNYQGAATYQLAGKLLAPHGAAA